MSNKADSGGFGGFVPGFDFLRQLAQGGQASLAGWVAPTLDPQALDKRIEELKAVQFWLDQNAAALKATLQALEVQKMALAAVHHMQNGSPGAAPQAQAAASTVDPMQFWTALTQQFQQIAGAAMNDLAARTASAPAAAQAASKTGGKPKGAAKVPPAQATAASPRPRRKKASP